MVSFTKNDINIVNHDFQNIRYSEKEILGWNGWVVLVCTVIATIFTVAAYFEARQGQPFINITINLFNKH